MRSFAPSVWTQILFISQQIMYFFHALLGRSSCLSCLHTVFFGQNVPCLERCRFFSLGWDNNATLFPKDQRHEKCCKWKGTVPPHCQACQTRRRDERCLVRSNFGQKILRARLCPAFKGTGGAQCSFVNLLTDPTPKLISR